ncbi:MAG: MmcQ/YjbR family DNA-binding protein [Alphaproteobacteria bacterium]|nr:MmcQ/YjbR family DNA-binding protein [Alphaproteobacteria bacterium]
MIAEIFKYKEPDFDKLRKFGFIENKNRYQFEQQILKGQFTLRVNVDTKGKVFAAVIDNDFNEEYVLHMQPSAAGSFVGQIRQEYDECLQKIADSCFNTVIFRSPQAKELINYVRQKYGNELEYLWRKFPNNAIWRRQDNKKWYGALLTVDKKKLGLSETGEIEIIDLRADTEILPQLIDNKKYFTGYHMNKKHWITICLNGSVDTEEIKQRIDNSYKIAEI